MPIMDIPFIGGAYQGRSTDLNSQQCINFMPVMDRQGGKSPISLQNTPGLTSVWCDLAATVEVRCLMVVGSTLVAVGGNKVYTIDTAASKTTLSGTLGASTGAVLGATNGTQWMIIEPGTDGYTNVGGTITAIADADFPVPTSVSYQDTYFIVSKNATGEFYISAANDPTAWDPTDYAEAEAAIDNLKCCFTHHIQQWLFGTETTEVWYNSGASAFPFERVSGVLIPYGIDSAASAASAADHLFWLTNTLQVGMSEGLSARIISTPQIDYQIASYSTTSDAIGYCYTLEGHICYVLTFPTAGATWVFDLTTGLWHEWQSWTTAPTTYGRHRGNCYAYFNGKHLVGDHTNGMIYELSFDAFDDIFGTIQSVRTTAPLSKENKRLFFNNLQVDFESGVGTSGGTERVSNGGFDSATTGWTAANGATLASIAGGQSGNCLRVTCDGTNNPYAYQDRNVVGGRSYTLTAYVKAGTEATYKVMMYDQTNGSDLGSEQAEETAGDWSTLVTITATIPATCRVIRIYLQQIATAGAGTTMLFDTVSMKDNESDSPDASLSWSDDGGQTFSSSYARGMGNSGSYKNLLRWNRLGKSRERVFKLTITDPVKRIILGASAQVEEGAH